MDSLDAQCLLIELTEPEMPPPQLWQHHRCGELSCAFSRGGRMFTWGTDAVAEMARRWRESNAGEVSENARLFQDAHRRLHDLVVQAGLEPADVVVHDFDRHELEARWEDRKAVMVIDEIGNFTDLPGDQRTDPRPKSHRSA